MDVDPKDSLLALTDEIEGRLQYFQELEHATRMLNHPGDSLVLQTDFLYMVERVDISIDYLRDHVSHDISSSKGTTHSRHDCSRNISKKQKCTCCASSNALHAP